MKVIVLNNFAVGQTHLGISVFAARSFKKNDVITQFTGKLFTKAQLPDSYEGEEDRYVQVGIDTYMGPSGKIDDLINHSCDPNAGLKFTNSGILLVAIKNIKEGDEITWDYSTTLHEDSWKMRCNCKKKNCRKIISEFALLPEKVQKRYRALGVIPQYLKDYMLSPEYSVYTKGIKRLKKHGRKSD